MSKTQHHISVAIDYYEKGEMSFERINQLINIWKDNGFNLDFYLQQGNKAHVEVTKSTDAVNVDSLRYQFMDAYDIAFGTKGSSNINPLSITLSAG